VQVGERGRQLLSLSRDLAADVFVGTAVTRHGCPS
jgi:hypothetical protein